MDYAICTRILCALVFFLLTGSTAATAADGEDPLGIGGMIEALVLSEFDSVEQVEIPTLARFRPEGGAEEREKIQIDVSATGPLRGDRLGMRVVTSKDGQVLKHGVLTVRVQGMRDVVIAKRNIGRSEIIAASDLEVTPRPLAELQADVATDAADVVGSRARRSMRAGYTVRSSFVEESPDVVRGQNVRLQLRRGGLRIDAIGQAKEDGRKGDWIKVLNTSSRREVAARVTGQGVVDVDL